jgi:hypothetical protein
LESGGSVVNLDYREYAPPTALRDLVGSKPE